MDYDTYLDILCIDSQAVCDLAQAVSDGVEFNSAADVLNRIRVYPRSHRPGLHQFFKSIRLSFLGR